MIFNRIIRICESFRSIWIILILFHRISGLGGGGGMGWTMLFKRYRFSIFATYFLYVCIFVYFYVNSYPYIYEHTHTHTPRNHEQAVYCVCSMLTVDTIRGMYDTYTWECYRKGPKYRHIVDISYAWIIISHFLPFWQASYHAMWNCGMYPQHKTQHTKQQKYV